MCKSCVTPAQKAFQRAIETGKLSANRKDVNFAGYWMYMYSKDDVDYFKNIGTREYMEVQVCQQPTK